MARAIRKLPIDVIRHDGSLHPVAWSEIDLQCEARGYTWARGQHHIATMPNTRCAAIWYSRDSLTFVAVVGTHLVLAARQ